MFHPYILILWISSSLALPQIALPFNSQVPPVARVGRNYKFQLSLNTFESSSTTLTYSLIGAPTWLILDNATRTLSGTPDQRDVGPSVFNINAMSDDGSVDMAATLVVAESPAPQPPQDISKYLAKAGILSSPSSVTIHPNCAFYISFPLGLFTGADTQKLRYYSTLVDHTPLPSWLSFDQNALNFSGITPGGTSSPQTFDVDLIASDVPGFAGALIKFTILTSGHQLGFNTSEQNVSIADGGSLDYTALLSQLILDGAPIAQSQITNATVQKPEWVKFDPKSLNLGGHPPAQEFQEDIIVKVIDNYGDQASIILHLQGCDTTANSTFFSKQQGDINATIGAPLDYEIEPSIFTEDSLIVSVNFGSIAPWLQFNETDLSIYGLIPDTVQPLVATATIIARSSVTFDSDTETFHISVVPATTSRRPPPASTSPTMPGNGQIASSSSSKGSKMPVGVLAAVCLVAAIIVIIPVLFVCQRFRSKRRRRYTKETSKPPSEGLPASVAHVSKQEPDLEKNEHRTRPTCSITPSDTTPGALDRGRFNSSARPQKRNSQASYLNEGEGTILSYHERSSWGRAATEGHTPHHSMSLATEIARQSRGSIQISPRRRAQLRSSQLSQLNSGQSCTRRISGIGHGWDDSQTSQSHPGSGDPFSSLESAAQYLIEAFPTPSAEASQAKALPTKHSRATRSLNKVTTGSVRRSKSIRQVERSPTLSTNRSSVLRSFDEEDERPLEARRQSYIRRRADNRSPFFSTVAAGSSRSSRVLYRNSSQIRLETSNSNGNLSFSPQSNESTSILGCAIDNLRRQRAPNNRGATRFSESSSLGQPGEIRSSLGASRSAPPPLDMTANASRQTESPSSFYSTDSSAWESDLNVDTDISPLEARRRDHDSITAASNETPTRVKRRHSGKRSAWAAKLGRDFHGQIGEASPLSTPHEEQTNLDTPSNNDRASLISSGRMSQLRRSRLVAETRAWNRRLPLSPLKDANVNSAISPNLEGPPEQIYGETNNAKGRNVVGLGLATDDDLETIHDRSNRECQELEREETPCFL